MIRKTEVVYSSPEGKPLVADLYSPSGKGPFPAVIYVHGGGWWSGNRNQLHRQAEDLAQKGYFGMAIEYRLAPSAHFPVAMDDVNAAIRWLHKNAGLYHVDSAKIFLMGSSSGAHLALMHVLMPQSPDTKVSAVVAFNPVLDLSDEPGQEAMVTRYLGKPCEEDLTLCHQASPAYLARNFHDSATRLFILHGTADNTVPYRQAEKFYEDMHANGSPIQLFTAEGAGHTFWAKPEWYSKTFDLILRFLEP